jgi:hypothetical protein
MFRFVDFGEVPEACAPVSNEAKRPSRSAKISISPCRGGAAEFQGKSVGRRSWLSSAVRSKVSAGLLMR